MTAPFTLSPQSTLLTPEVPGLAALVHALRSGASIRASQSRAPITSGESTAAPWLYCETSGTTGAPKVIRRRPASWQASFEVTRQHVGLGPGDRYATLGSLGHSLTLYAALEALHLGANLALVHGMGPRQQAAALTQMQITTLYATPAQLHLLTLGNTPLPRLRHVFSGGGKLPPALHDRLTRLCPGAEIREFYGTSETSFITLGDTTTPPASVGRSYPGVEIRLSESGEVEVRSPYLFDGYEGGPAHPAGGFLATGEIGHLDAAGHLYLRGRANRRVTVADHNVFPDEIERLLATLPDVTACAVVARPDPVRGHRLTCFLTGTAAEPDLRRACRSALGPQAVPHRFVRMQSLPMLPAGKPDLQALQHLPDPAP